MVWLLGLDFCMHSTVSHRHMYMFLRIPNANVEVLQSHKLFVQMDFARAVALGQVAELFPASMSLSDATTIDIAIHEASPSPYGAIP